MFRFEHPDVFQWLLVLPILVLVAIWARRMHLKKVARLGDRRMIENLIADFSKYKFYLHWFLLLIALALLVISWANPQWGSRKEQVEARRADVLIALDISTSMLAEDVAPSRLIRAKRFAEQLIQSLRGERIGLILFAGNAYLQMPLTADYAAAQMFLQSANPNMASTQGTAIGDAITLASRIFQNQQEDSHEALIIISDGENHDEGAIAAASSAAEGGLLIYTVGIGTEQGAFIPLVIGGREDYKRDQKGNPVGTQYDPALLKDIARDGRGQYYDIQEGAAIFASIKEEIRQIEKDTLEERSFTDFQSYFKYFLIFSLIILAVDAILTNRRSKYLRDKDIFRI
jgi:Ca-activated chloride channel family protein